MPKKRCEGTPPEHSMRRDQLRLTSERTGEIGVSLEGGGGGGGGEMQKNHWTSRKALPTTGRGSTISVGLSPPLPGEPRTRPIRARRRTPIPKFLILLCSARQRTARRTQNIYTGIYNLEDNSNPGLNRSLRKNGQKNPKHIYWYVLSRRQLKSWSKSEPSAALVQPLDNPPMYLYIYGVLYMETEKSLNCPGRV